MFRDLSWIWPVINPVEKYTQDSKLFTELIKEQALFPVKTLLHLGSGGGHNDFSLNPHFEITGVDFSTVMIDLARKRNPQVNYIYGDMRNLLLDRHFDSVIITESINYMLTECDLRDAFDTAYIHLKPGGVFLSTITVFRETFQNRRSDCRRHCDGDLDVTVIESHFDPDPSDTTYDTVFVYLIRDNGKLSVEVERHVNGLFRLETFETILSQVGFRSNRLELDDGRQIFIGLKPM